MYEEREILKKLIGNNECYSIEKYILGEKILPRAYCPSNGCHIKAIVLGCDPSTKEYIQFKSVFGLGEGDENFFGRIEDNLKEIGVEKENVYVQNLVRNYMHKTTGEYFKGCGRVYSADYDLKDVQYNERNEIWVGKVKRCIDNNIWVKVANQWIDSLIEDLDKVDIKREIPVLITSEYLIPVLINSESDCYKRYIKSAKIYYGSKETIKASDNKLGRLIIPLFRNDDYLLNPNKFLAYKKDSNNISGNRERDNQHDINIKKERNKKYAEYIKSIINK